MSYFNRDVVRMRRFYLGFFSVFSKMLSVRDASLYTSADDIFPKDERGNRGIFFRAGEKVKIPCFNRRLEDLRVLLCDQDSALVNFVPNVLFSHLPERLAHSSASAYTNCE